MTEQELAQLFATAPQAEPVFYRLYHDEQGIPLFYSMEHVPGTYIEISQEDYNRGLSNVRVRNSKLVELTWQTSQKIVPSTHGTQCHPNDVAIVVNNNGIYWSKRTYESS